MNVVSTGNIVYKCRARFNRLHSVSNTACPRILVHFNIVSYENKTLHNKVMNIYIFFHTYCVSKKFVHFV